MSDPIADFCTIIRNGYLVKKSQVVIPHSKVKEAIAKILVKEGYIKNLKVGIDESKFKKMTIELKYDENGQPVLTEIQKVSKPGMKVYKKVNKLPRILSGLGIAIVSTSKGLMTDEKARIQNLGGELICKLW